MLAKEKWQIKTIEVLERVFEERVRQMEKHGAAMETMPGGTGPDVQWLHPFDVSDATTVQMEFRGDYNTRRAAPGRGYGQLTRMHLVREELAEAFELDENDPAFVDEILQVAALCVQWVEYKLSGH